MRSQEHSGSIPVICIKLCVCVFSGGRAEACFSLGPPQALLRPRDSLKHLPVQIPHRLDTATNRLSSPATGMDKMLHSMRSGYRQCPKNPVLSAGFPDLFDCFSFFHVAELVVFCSD